VIVLYDADCGFCRWAMAWAMNHDDRNQLVPVPIESELGGELLDDLEPTARLRSAHAIADDGKRRSGGAAVAAVLGLIQPAHLGARLARGLPRITNLLYGVVAKQRVGFGRFVDQDARQCADQLLEARRVTTRAELDARSPARD
jgi:predicted DCC family thiol-disulfide oxidoreductase YuxK